MASQLDAVVVALFSGGDVLLVSNHSNKWGFPGGMLKAGERHGYGARRKVQEETGINIWRKPLEALGAVSKHEGHQLHLFGAKLEQGAFDNLGSTGPRGHRLLRCPVQSLAQTHLYFHHELLLQRLVEKRNAKAK